MNHKAFEAQNTVLALKCHYLFRHSTYVAPLAPQSREAEWCICTQASIGSPAEKRQHVPRQTYHFENAMCRLEGFKHNDNAATIVMGVLRYMPPKCIVVIPIDITIATYNAVISAQHFVCSVEESCLFQHAINWSINMSGVLEYSEKQPQEKPGIFEVTLNAFWYSCPVDALTSCYLPKSFPFYEVPARSLLSMRLLEACREDFIVFENTPTVEELA
ncbi:hypothetical protein D8B26_005379 [Coccidioides posadasii str. Silveira]|uniref:Predicted protein n=1 Tax=Coccidioides posadasii (strain RMSCC 757 / Silveira) TaxID=443226 RepID=E9D548_COCPS|nr:predicted protein [Coccidioides posadasii str. Silveira]QVM10726.1 hypothetical protein D8B26_005379 [Coccidioides posadasii str. Silveira]